MRNVVCVLVATAVALAVAPGVAAEEDPYFEDDAPKEPPERYYKSHHAYYIPLVIPIGAMVWLCRICVSRCAADPAPRTSVRVLSAGSVQTAGPRRDSRWWSRPTGRRGLIAQEHPPAQDATVFLPPAMPMLSPVQQGMPPPVQQQTQPGSTPMQPPSTRRWWAPWDSRPKQQESVGELPPRLPPPPSGRIPPPRPPPPQPHGYPASVFAAPSSVPPSAPMPGV